MWDAEWKFFSLFFSIEAKRHQRRVDGDKKKSKCKHEKAKKKKKKEHDLSIFPTNGAQIHHARPICKNTTKKQQQRKCTRNPEIAGHSNVRFKKRIESTRTDKANVVKPMNWIETTTARQMKTD